MLLGFNGVYIFLGVIFVWLSLLSFFLYRFSDHYRSLTQGVTKKDLKSVLDKLFKDFDQAGKKTEGLNQELEKLKQGNEYNIQKIGLVRFNPFAETGGDQSFCLAVLDGRGSGLVISSLHSRDTTRIYAKPVKESKSAGYELSDEERLAIKKAKRIK